MINMTQNQQTQVTFTVLDQNGNTVAGQNYTFTGTVSDPTVLQFSINAFGQGNIKALKIGTATISYVITANSNSGYEGTLNVGPDSFTVNPIAFASATDNYTTPQ